MKEEQLHAYLNLINAILSCPSGKEIEILNANQDLIDTALVETMVQVANVLVERGDQDNADFLIDFVRQLSEALGLSKNVQTMTAIDRNESEIAPSENSLDFLLEVLQATNESNGNPQVVYPLLAANLEKIDETFAYLLEQWATTIFVEVESEEAEAIAITIVGFSNLIQQYPLGNKATNLEIAIAGYRTALTFFHWEKTPGEWAVIQSNLGNVYLNRILGDRAENLELAIQAHIRALEIRTCNANPEAWAITQNNLGNAYLNRIRGDKAENLELAIAAYAHALSVFTSTTHPEAWANTQNNLGNAYLNRICGDRAENLELAIAAYTSALSVFSRTTNPEAWANTQNNLGNAYTDRILGDKAENLEQGIACYHAALTVYTLDAFPQQWATTQNNLGSVYGDRIRGEKSENLELAIACYHAALQVRSRKAFPQEWAATQNNLGAAYSNRIRGEKAENIENAIATYTVALTVYTREALPQQWAMTQNNLAIAYSNRIKGDRAENIEMAIAAYTTALTVYTREALPINWAATQNNLAIAYSNRIKGDRAENIEMAIAAYTAALTVYTREALPQNHAETLWGLGIAYQDANQFDLAYNTFKSAIVTIESLREEIVSGDESKRKQAEHFNQVYSRIVEVCWQLNKITEAIEYVEQSKTRNLVEQILERDSKTIFPPDVVTQLETYRDEIAAGQSQIQNGQAENPQDLAKRLQELRRQRNELQNRYLPVGYGFDFNSFQATLNENTVIIEWYILDDKVVAFIVTKTAEVKVWQSQPEDLEALINWVIEYLQNYYTQKDQWQNSLGEELKKLASILHIDEILTQIPNHCDKLIFIPHRFLHLFPLHALPITSQKYQDSPCLLDLFPAGVSYAPSCQLLQQVQQRQRPDFQSLLAIQNPTEDLYFTNLEVETILSYFPSYQVLTKKQATKNAIYEAATQLQEVNYLHFSCHGYFNLGSPLKSALVLADETNSTLSIKQVNTISEIVSEEEEKIINLKDSNLLTLKDIFNLNLSQCRLVTLSACETGLTDFTSLSDEYIGLPSGFLVAGSSSVVSSIWAVQDFSTAFLMIKFYENLQNQTSVANALNQAQLWLRNTTKPEFEKWIAHKLLPLNKRLIGIIKEHLDHLPDDDQPFQSPFYWAGFCAIGQS